jgi:hypothetical protein
VFWNLPKLVTPTALGIELIPIINQMCYIWHAEASKECFKFEVRMDEIREKLEM